MKIKKTASPSQVKLYTNLIGQYLREQPTITSAKIAEKINAFLIGPVFYPGGGKWTARRIDKFMADQKILPVAVTTPPPIQMPLDFSKPHPLEKATAEILRAGVPEVNKIRAIAELYARAQ